MNGEPMRYQMTQRFFSLGGRYDIRTDRDEIAWSARVRLFALGTTITLESGDGRPAARLRRRVMSFPGTWDFAPQTGPSAVIKRNFRLLRGSLTVTDETGRIFVADGDFMRHEYVIESEGEVIALVSKKFFSARDRYGISMSREGDEPEAGDLLPIAIALIMDRAHHEHQH